MTSRRSSSTAGGEGESPSLMESTEQAFRKLFASVADPQTCDHVQRHLALTKNVLYQNEHGWKLAELPMVAELLMVLRDKVLSGAAQFRDQLLNAIVLCGKPFVRLKSNEELSNPTLLADFVPTLGQLLAVEIVEIQVAVAEALRQFVIGSCLTRPTKSKNQTLDQPSADDLRLPTRIMSMNVLEETGTVDLIITAFQNLFPKDDQAIEDEEGESGPPVAVSQEGGEELRPLTPSTTTTEVPAPTGTPPSASDGEARAQLLFCLVDLVYELSSHQRCAEVLVISQALPYTVFVLSSISSPQDELLPLCLTTLWNVLELCEEKIKSVTKCGSRRELLVQFRLRNATFALSNEFVVETLLKTLEMLLLRGYRRQDKELRNECLMILLLLAKRQRSLDLFYTTGLTACLLSYATASELARKKLPSTSSTTSTTTATTPSSSVAIVADAHNYATNSDEDLEFKQLLWLLLSVASTIHSDNLQSIAQFRFFEILLDYATATSNDQQQGKQQHGKSSSSSAQAYSSGQLQLLQSAAFTVLLNLAPQLLDHFYELQGHVQLLEFVQLAVGCEQVLLDAWQLLVHVAPSEPRIQDELGRLGALEISLAAFAMPPSRHTFAIRRNAILICARLCRTHERNRVRFFQHGGVALVLKHLTLDVAHWVLEENILIGIIEAVRSCIVGHSESELAFLRDDGVPKLLDILEKAPKAIKNQVLAALAEITVNPASIPSYAGWRSDHKDSNNANASQVLLRLYAEEEAIEEKLLRAAVEYGSDDPTGPQLDDPQQQQQQQRAVVAATSLRTSAFKSIATCTSPFVVFSLDPVDDLALQSSPRSPSEGRPTSPAFARLKDALKAAAAGQTTTTTTQPMKSSLLELHDGDFHPQLHLKAKIHAILANLSFVCEPHDRLSTKELLMLEIAKEYPTFRVGEMWQNVELTLHAEGTRPIYADALYIRKQIECAYNTSVCTKFAQQQLACQDQKSQQTQENAFFMGILQQKQQNEQLEEFHRVNKRQNSTMKLHLDAKATRLEFMKRQDPTAFNVYEKEQSRKIQDPPPVHEEELTTLAQKEKELRGRLSTIQISPSSKTH